MPYEIASWAEALRWILDDPEVHPAMPKPRLIAHTSVLNTNILSKITLMTWLNPDQELHSLNVSSAGCS